MVTFRKIFLLTICCTISIVAGAQKVKTVSATIAYHASESMSVEEAKRIALERAKIQAIADEFGTIVSQNNSTIVKNINGKSNIDFISIGRSDIKGEWIETIGEPKYDIKFDSHTIVVECFVKGKAREIASGKIEFVAKTLRNGTGLRFADIDFRDGDDLYLYFQSPTNGYLAVYLLDEMTQTVYCVLPYKAQTISAYPIEGGKEYILFSRKETDKSEGWVVDEYTLSCENDKEFNTIYILFSSSNISKRNGFDVSIVDKPSNISFKEFNSWLSKILIKDSNIQFQEINISISK